MNRTLPRWIANLTTRSPRSRARTIRRVWLAAPEALEGRELKTIGLVPALGVIEVQGSGADDKVRVSIQVAANPLNAMIDVQLTSGNNAPVEKLVPLYNVTYKGVVRNYTRLEFYGGGGNDTLIDNTDLKDNVLSIGVNHPDQLTMDVDPAAKTFDAQGSSDNDDVHVYMSWTGSFFQADSSNSTSSLHLFKKVLPTVGTQLTVNTITSDLAEGDDAFTNDTGIPATVYGGAGNDILVGGSGDDTLYGDGKTSNPGYYAGDAYHNIINGREGNDHLQGGDGDDIIFGGVGNDTIYGAGGNDLLLGQAGDDYLSAGDGDDTVVGDLGNDQISGGAGADSLYGNDGNDSIWDDANDKSWNTLDGGSGNDTVEVNGFGNLHGGEGNDFVALYGSGNAYGDAGKDSLEAGGNGLAWLFGGDDDDLLFTIATVAKVGMTTYMNGGEGNDELLDSGGSDALVGGGGNDLLCGGGGDDFLYGGDGNDTLIGGDGSDHLYGEGGNDIIDGGDSFGHTDNTVDYLSGGSGWDQFIVDNDSINNIAIDIILDFNAAEGDAKKLAVQVI